MLLQSLLLAHTIRFTTEQDDSPLVRAGFQLTLLDCCIDCPLTNGAILWGGPYFIRLNPDKP